MLSYLTVCANIGLFHFSFSIRNLVPLLSIPPSPSIPQPSCIENLISEGGGGGGAKKSVWTPSSNTVELEERIMNLLLK